MLKYLRIAVTALSLTACLLLIALWQIGFEVRVYENPKPVGVQHLLLIILTIATAVAPWIHWPHRFSLRTLLIATTLVAVGLGVIVLSR